MVQPRKEQVKNLKTRHSRVVYFPAAGEAYTEILDASMYSQVISDTPGGAQENTPAIVRSTLTEPYSTVIAGDEITIAVDSLTPVVVTFVAGDTTASRIANRINTAVGFDAALNDEGTLVLFSTLTGEDGYITLADSTAGSLSKIGLTAGTTTGTTAPNRGIVTEEYDIELIGGSNWITRGGFIPIRSGDGRVVTTDANSLSRVSNTFRRIDTPGGMPIHGRIIRNPSDTGYWILYYAKMPVEATVKTFGGNFADLDGTDSLTIGSAIQYKDEAVGFGIIVSLTITFPAGPYDRDSVVTRINEVFAAQVASGNGNASVMGTISQPFSIGSNDDFKIAVDGGSYQNVGLAGSEVTAQDIVDKINLLTGVTASVIDSIGYNRLIKIESDETDGTTSSLDIQNSDSEDTLQKIGILPGLYRGVFIAEPYGDEEIILKGLNRGGSSKLEIGGNAATLTRMGLVSGTYYGDNGSEVKVDFPTLDVIANADAFSYLLVPEIVEYGETDLRVESILQQFDSNFSVSSGGKGSNTIAENDFNGLSRGIADSGKPVTVNALGQIDTKFIRSVQDNSQNTLKKFIIGDFTPGVNSVEKIAVSAIQTPGTDGNPLSKSDRLTISVDPDQTYPTPFISIDFWKDTGGATTPFIYSHASGFTNIDWFFYLGINTGILSETALKLLDANTRDAATATGGIEDLPLTDSTGGRYPRVMEIEGNNLAPRSLVGKLNSMWTVTVGDGSISYGDFSGSTAIESAIDFFVANAPSGMDGIHVLVKPGDYEVSSTYSLPDGKEIIIEGTDQKSCLIKNTSSLTSDAIFEISTSNIGVPSKLTLKNLFLAQAGFGSYVVDSTSSHLHMDNCWVLGLTVKITEDKFYTDSGYPACLMRNCVLDSPVDLPLIHIAAADASRVGYIIENCLLKSVADNPVLRVEDVGASADTTIGGIIFDRCQIFLAGTTVDGSANLVGNPGVLELVPSTPSFFTLESITWKDCDVNAGTNTCKILAYVRTYDDLTETINIGHFKISGGKWIAPAGTTVIAPFYIGGNRQDSAPLVSRITIEDLEWGFDGAADYGTGTAELSVVASEWAAFVIGSSDRDGASSGDILDQLEIRNVKFHTCTMASRCGDLWINGMAKAYSVDGIYLRSWAAGSSLTPDHRIRLTGNRLADGVAKNIVASADRTGILGTFVNEGIFRLEPNGSNDPRYGGLVLENCIATNFNGSTSNNAFFLYNEDTEFFCKNLTMRGCKASNNLGSGFYYRNESNAGNDYLRHLNIENCEFNHHGVYGIYLSAKDTVNAVAFNEIRITNNVIRDNTSYGILFAPGVWSSSEHTIIINDNLVVENAGTGNDDQIWIGRPSGGDEEWGTDARMVIQGNMCGGDSDSAANRGAIVFSFDGGGPAPGVTSWRNAWGAETQYDGAAPYTRDSKESINDALMLQNSARFSRQGT
jgi:hypothetical protein